MMDELIKSGVIFLFEQYPALAALLTVMTIARAIMKPLQKVIDVYVAITPNDADNKIWAKIKNSKIIDILIFVIDWLLSVKVQKK